jgi:hypothetical protein
VFDYELAKFCHCYSLNYLSLEELFVIARGFDREVVRAYSSEKSKNFKLYAKKTSNNAKKLRDLQNE